MWKRLLHLAIFLSVGCFYACKSNSSVIKRKYNKGYFFAGKNSPVQSKKNSNQAMSLSTADVHISDDIHFINNQYSKNENQQTISENEGVEIKKKHINDKEKWINNDSIIKKENNIETKKHSESNRRAFFRSRFNAAHPFNLGLGLWAGGVLCFAIALGSDSNILTVLSFLMEGAAVFVFLKLLIGRNNSNAERFLGFLYLVFTGMILWAMISILLLSS